MVVRDSDHLEVPLEQVEGHLQPHVGVDLAKRGGSGNGLGPMSNFEILTK